MAERERCIDRLTVLLGVWLLPDGVVEQSDDLNCCVVRYISGHRNAGLRTVPLVNEIVKV